MDPHQFTRLGLTDAESLIYYAIIKLGTGTVKDISKECGFHRTNIYDVLDTLKEKGLVTFFKEGKVQKFRASDPHVLYDLLNEKKELLDKMLPELDKLFRQTIEPVQVDVYKGDEGMKAAFRDVLRAGKPIYGFGIRGQLRQKLPEFATSWLREAEKKKIDYFAIYTERNPPPMPHGHFRFVSAELGSPVATFIYGDKIFINIWEPSLTAIVITSKLVAQMYKKHFDLLSGLAKK